VDGKMTLSFLHCEKAFFCFSFQKIPLYRIDNPIVDTRTFSPKPIDLFPFPHARKLFRSMNGDLLHYPMPGKSSGLGMRHFTILLARKI
jgi:hypothetical protein